MIDPTFFSAFIASRICHDMVSPVSSVASALEMLDDDTLDEEMRGPSEDLLRDGAKKLQAYIMFLRYAFGYMGMSDSVADIHEAKKITEDYVSLHRPSIEWDIKTEHFTYHHVRLMMHMVLYGMTCLPRGGVISVEVRDHHGLPSLVVNAKSDRPKLKPEILAAIAGEVPEEGWNSRNVNVLLAVQVAEELGTTISANAISDTEIVFAASKINLTTTLNREGIS
ncbi:MAG: histidine phosphotransferase family protein [Hyphomonadaceae bacterium]